MSTGMSGMYVCIIFYSLSWSGRRLEVGDGMILVVYLGCLVYVYVKGDWRIGGGLEGLVPLSWFFLGKHT